eukprot:scaffold155292_cov26-Tisochrysis_lutea.AAC.2
MPRPTIAAARGRRTLRTRKLPRGRVVTSWRVIRWRTRVNVQSTRAWIARWRRTAVERTSAWTWCAALVTSLTLGGICSLCVSH